MAREQRATGPKIEAPPPATPEIDVGAARSARPWTPAQILARALWEAFRGPLFAWSPRPLWGWRALVLRLFGARIGARVHLYPSVRIAVPWNLDIADEVAVGDGAILYSLGAITIGRAATISQYAHICAGTHDFRDPAMPLLRPPIDIGSGAWVCADAFIGPGVKVGSAAVVAARAVVVRDVAERAIVAGNPARPVGMR
ncbi:MAG: hypothetical protein JNJ73_20225 [Hyphomonadaceae bacterium]|nr:hypothetical protein [Hyphomonadaceae bacterium]